jgi:hypothetical protein
VDLYQEPVAVALLAHHAHSIRVLLLMAFRRRRLRALGQKPSHGPGGRDVTAVPRPRVRGRPPHVALKKGPDLIAASEKRFLGRDHHDVGIRCEEPHDAVGVPRGEPGAEALEDFEQRGFRLRIRPHGQAILTSF